jgi:hypothetical protein
MSTAHPNDPTTTADPAGPIRHVLSDDDIASILATIRDAENTQQLVSDTVGALYDAILVGREPTSGGSTSLIPDVRPGDYALPSSQWQAIVSAVTQRAQQWGTQAEAGLELALNLMPGQYDDPTVAPPQLPLPDYRPVVHTLLWARDAVDVVTACTLHLDRLRDAYGPYSPLYLDASDSWHRALTAVIAMNTGATTTVSKDGPMDLLVNTSSGLIYAVVFHAAARRCTVTGCGARLLHDGTVQPVPTGAPAVAHQHAPSYPLDGPRPGAWSLHS